MMKIIRRASYILYTFTLLFSTVNVHGNLFVRSASDMSSKDCVMAVYLHVKLQSPSSVAIVWQKETVCIVIIIIIIQCSHSHSQLQPLTCMGTQARAELYQLRMTFVRVLISNCNAGITLTLQGSGCARLYFQRNLYGASMQCDCTYINISVAHVKSQLQLNNQL